MPSHTPEQFRAIIEAAARYLHTNERRIRTEKEAPEWNAERVTQSLVFHAVRHTLALAWLNGQIVGAAIAWQDSEDRLRAADVRGESAFHWQESDPAGDCLYFALLVTSHKDAMKKLVGYFHQRFGSATVPVAGSAVPAEPLRNVSRGTRETAGGTPALPLKLLAHRRGKLVEETGIVERICHV